jgi:hypothetical protein
MPGYGLKIAAVLTSTICSLAPLPAHACGGFFCTTFPISQVSERILFVQGSGTVTTHVQIQYSGRPEDFAWILPVPTLPELTVSHNELFRQLELSTQPSFVLDFEGEENCFFFPPFIRFTDAVAEAGGVEIVAEEQVGPFDTVIITGDDPQAVANWLQENGYLLDGIGIDLLAPYVNNGFHFVALKLAPNKDVGDLQPIALSYAADRPGIPIQLTAIATEPDLGVIAWVLAENRAIPENYLHVEINEAKIDWLNGGQNYQALVAEAANEAGGNAFTTDYAGSSDIMADRVYRAGQYDLDRLRATTDPVAYLDELLRQGFPRDTQTQSLIRRHIPMPSEVLTDGVLHVVYRGDLDAYSRAQEDGTLPAIADQSFYNNMAAYAEWTGSLLFSPTEMTDDIEVTIVTPLQESQQLFTDNPYLTRLFTTLSANEMTVDPMFAYNPDLPEVPAVRRATARCECPEGVDPDSIKIEDKTIVITLSDGREIRVNPDPGPIPFPFDPLPLPSATIVQRLTTSGPAETIRTLTAINSDFNDDGETTQDDLPDFISVFGKSAPRYDLDGDGVIGFGDFLRFVEAVNAAG